MHFLCRFLTSSVQRRKQNSARRDVRGGTQWHTPAVPEHGKWRQEGEPLLEILSEKEKQNIFVRQEDCSSGFRVGNDSPTPHPQANFYSAKQFLPGGCGQKLTRPCDVPVTHPKISLYKATKPLAALNRNSLQRGSGVSQVAAKSFSKATLPCRK